MFELIKYTPRDTTPLTLDLTDPVTLTLLGRPCFWHATFARMLHAAGLEEIPTHAEEEQAASIIWLVRMRQKHGETWIEEVNQACREMHVKLKAETEARHAKLSGEVPPQQNQKN